MTATVQTHELTRLFPTGDNVFAAIDGITFALQPGEFTAIMGPSGSGKSTFMNIVGCLDRQTSGTYLLDGIDVSTLDANRLADLRRTKLGFVFQQYNLLARTSAVENVELPLIYASVAPAQRRERAAAALLDVGLDARHHLSMPNELSGGQQQRVAIARALVNAPSLILADEPTGALDSKNSRDLMELFLRLNRERGMTILMVTHELDIARYAYRTVTFLDGHIVTDEPVAAPSAVAAG
ncbi:MAG TPA: ABC transporter ATP-binding protein [Candidatus Baltobacteraceae bacterium]|nr:ABC transporter ATP-binding protein [Candidatus Baltobacteraceae bacterium]